MMFNSIEFLFFFAITTTLYFSLPHKFRWFLLLLASCIFYMSFVPAYILVLGFTIVVDYIAGIYIGKAETSGKKKIFLVASLISTLSVLFVFKYFNFFNANLDGLAEFLRWNYPISTLALVLPIGLSFHTFQSLSYVFEVYKGRQKAEHNFGIYSLYVMFYPQLVAGPIERPYNLLPQFYEEHKFVYSRVKEGLEQMAFGFFKKLVVADRLAEIVNGVYANPGGYDGFSLMISTVFFAFQIYCDFSGYCDIALGAAKVMGFTLTNNFDKPYLSKSVSDFWRKWHISLSYWFRDYVYIPLGGSRTSPLRHYFNLMAVFLISGLWHGASWTFVIWGGLHGAYVVFESVTKGMREKAGARLGRIPFFGSLAPTALTFILVCVAWVFFRANSVEDALYVLTHMAGASFSWNPSIFQKFDRLDFVLSLAAIAAVLAVEWVDWGGLKKKASSPLFSKIVYTLSDWRILILIWAILLFGSFGKNEFIYFRF